MADSNLEYLHSSIVSLEQIESGAFNPSSNNYYIVVVKDGFNVKDVTSQWSNKEGVTFNVLEALNMYFFHTENRDIVTMVLKDQSTKLVEKDGELEVELCSVTDVGKVKENPADLQKCIKHAQRALQNHNVNCDLSSWERNGTLQGKMIAVADGDSVATLCCDANTNLIHGIARWKGQNDSLQSLVADLNKLKITGNTRDRPGYRNLAEFLETTESGTVSVEEDDEF